MIATPRALQSHRGVHSIQTTTPMGQGEMARISHSRSHKDGQVLIMGLCLSGPFKYAKENIENSTVDWLNWHYHSEYVHSEILNDIQSKKIRRGTQVIFCCWNLKKSTRAQLLRKGRIDHITYRGGSVSFTIFLSDFVSGFANFFEDDHLLCKYISSDYLTFESGLIT